MKVSGNAIGNLVDDIRITSVENIEPLSFESFPTAKTALSVENAVTPDANVALAAVRPKEVRLSPDGSRLFSSNSDGYIRVYDMHSGSLINSWHVGQKLGGMDISPDGSFLVVVERNLSVVYKVDTVTGAKTTFSYATSGQDGLLFDVAVLSDGTALFSQDFNGSGSVTLKDLNFTTGIFTAGPQVNQASQLSRSASGDRVLIGEPNSSGGPIDIYRTGVGIVATSGAGGYNWGIQAFSGSGALAAQYIYNEGIHVYNASLQRQITLTAWNYGLVSDLAFSADGAFLYVLDNQADTVVKISTSDWSTAAVIPVGADVGGWLGQVGATNGDRLIVDKLGRYISVVTDTGLVLVENTAADAINGTGGSDTIEGALFADRIYGLAGDDTLYGYAGSDQLFGGDGNDLLDGGVGVNTLSGGAGNDRLIVGAGADGTTVDGGADSDTLVVTGAVSLGGVAGIEAIELQSGAALTMTGAQFNTFQPGSAISGTGSVIIDMAPDDIQVSAQFLSVAQGSAVTFTINGSSAVDTIKGSIGAPNTIDGGDGGDQIRGGQFADAIVGGAGDDKIAGVRGADILTGGAGADTFRYLTAQDSGLGAGADHITDFTIGTDKLGFTLIDADAVAAGDQAFAFIGTAAFTNTGVGQIHYLDSGADLLVQVDIDGNGTADMDIVLNGLVGHALTAADFLL